MTAKNVQTIDASTFSIADRQRIAAVADRFGQDEQLPEEVVAFFAGLLGRLADGRQIATIEKDELLTSNQAADLIGLSRPLLNRLLDEGRLPFHNTDGGHRRVRDTVLEHPQHGADDAAYRPQRLGRAALEGRRRREEVPEQLVRPVDQMDAHDSALTDGRNECFGPADGIRA